MTNMFFGAIFDWLPLTTYDVRVRAYVGGAWQSFNNTCQITTASAFTGGGGSSSIALPTVNGGSGVSKMTVYPNPNSGGDVWVALPEVNSTSEEATLIVYDLYGKQVFAENFAIDGSFINRRINFSSPLQSGVYLVTVTIDGERQTSRLVIK